MQLPGYILEKYIELQPQIIRRLEDFSKVPKENYFYELCYCLCTPQSKAKNALIVQKKLMDIDFLNNPSDVSNILRNPENYIRFHNIKNKRLLEARENFHQVIHTLQSKLSPTEKRNYLAELVKGIGMKEASHFMRNIGYRNLAILDRHILKHLKLCGLFTDSPKISSVKNYLETEKTFRKFSQNVNIPIDHLDLLFWSYETGEILK